jgi:hypothetical protein
MRGLTFILLDISSLSLLVFTDASFINNKDLYYKSALWLHLQTEISP